MTDAPQRFPSLTLWRVRLVASVLLVGTNVIGALVVFCLITFVVPVPEVQESGRVRLANLVLAAVYVGVAVLVGTARGWVLLHRATVWLRGQREPSSEEKQQLLRTPGRIFWMQAQLWGAAAVVFGVFNVRFGAALGPLVASVIVLAGLTVCSVTYLMAEWALRPLARRALASGVPDRLGARSVTFRALQAWTLGTAVSVAGLVYAGLNAFWLGEDVTKLRLQVTMITLGGTALVVGLLTTLLAAKATADPVQALRRAVARVGRGHLDTRIDIYDGTEIGILQAGFNDMVVGLRERETIRDLFGRHVGNDVARAALEGGVRLGGETREVAVLFVDVIGSTTLAAERPPQEVVSLLNRFFDVVIDVVHEYDGWINKFEGDAALAIWGAPVDVPGREARALAAARVMGERLARDVPELAAGIGVSAGVAVAGNVGAAERYEYTVIGDPVNEAARLTGEAKQVPARVIANAALLDGAGEEATHWTELAPITVRGRPEPTRTATPT